MDMGGSIFQNVILETIKGIGIKRSENFRNASVYGEDGKDSPMEEQEEM